MFSRPTPRPSQRPQTNPKFAHFRQEHFTAGTEEQFLKCTEEVEPIRISPYHTQGDQVSPLFQHVDSAAKIGTFHYLFYGVKKSIFIRIRRGRVAVFLPFSNADYENEWHSRVECPPEWRANFQAPMNRWYANNYLFRHEWPINEGDTGVAALKHMFETVCAERDISDVDVFVNKRDFPVLREDLCEPYDAIYGPNQPLINGARTNYLPILSMVRAPQFADIAIPTAEDWTRICAQHDPPGFFFSSKREQHIGSVTPGPRWSDKIPQVVFRGSSTGRGRGLQNLRIRLTTMVQGDPRFNVGITSLSGRWHIEGGRLIPPQHDFPTVPFMSPEEQRKYKFIIHVNGHVRGFRLSNEFSYGSVILLVDAPHQLWFEKYLVDGVHYISVASDLSNLMEKVDWCFRNDARAAEIARAAESFCYTRLSREATLDELATTLNTVAIHARPQQDYLSSQSTATHARQIQAAVSRLPVPNFAAHIPHTAVPVARYLKGYEFIPADWEAILGQIYLALLTAQRYLRFTHHALTPETTWLQELKALTTVDYILGENQVARITTRRVVLFSHFEDAHVEGIKKIQGFDPECDMESLTRAAADLIYRFQSHRAGTFRWNAAWTLVPFAEHVFASLAGQKSPLALAHSLLRRFDQQRRSLYMGARGEEEKEETCILKEEPWFCPRELSVGSARLIRCALEDMLTFGGPHALDEREREHVKHILRSINA